MKDLQHFAVVGGRAEFRPVGHLSFTELTRLISAALAEARRLGIGQILVDTTAVEGLKSPSLASRYFAIRQWSAAAGGKVTLALLARPEMIDPQRFGEVVARNAGMNSRVFSTENAALAWLEVQKGEVITVRALREPARDRHVERKR